MITNKTNRTIYIDKGNCFKVMNYESYCYYNPTEQTTIGRGSGVGTSLKIGAVAGAIGLGGTVGQLASGITIEGSSSKSSSTTLIAQRVIAIPPHSIKNLCESKRVEISSSWYKLFDPCEQFFSLYNS